MPPPPRPARHAALTPYPPALFGLLGQSGVFRLMVDVWLTAVDGQYAVQRVGEKGVDPRNLCGVFHSDDAGGFSFKCIRPTVYKASRTTLAGILAAPSKDSSDNIASIADRCRRTGRGASCFSTARGMRGGRRTYTSSSARRGMRRSRPTSSAG